MEENPRLRWLLRRGLKELDVLFERYYARRYPLAAGAERAAFAQLLQCEDPHIQQWILGQSTVPDEFEHVVAELRRHD